MGEKGSDELLKENLRRNHSIMSNGLELIILGSFFIVNSFRFERIDIFNIIATHLDDPFFSALLVFAGTVCVMVAFYNINQLKRWCLVGSTFIWLIYGGAFLIKNIELWGNAFGNLDCWFMFAMGLRTIFDAWAGDAE